MRTTLGCMFIITAIALSFITLLSNMLILAIPTVVAMAVGNTLIFTE